MPQIAAQPREQRPPRRHAALPVGCVPIGLRREEAAAYVGMSAGSFDRAVKEGAMPPPRQWRGVVTWDREELERAFRALPRRGSEDATTWGVDETSNPWDD